MSSISYLILLIVSRHSSSDEPSSESLSLIFNWEIYPILVPNYKSSLYPKLFWVWNFNSVIYLFTFCDFLNVGFDWIVIYLSSSLKLLFVYFEKDSFCSEINDFECSSTDFFAAKSFSSMKRIVSSILESASSWLKLCDLFEAFKL